MTNLHPIFKEILSSHLNIASMDKNGFWSATTDADRARWAKEDAEREKQKRRKRIDQKIEQDGPFVESWLQLFMEKYSEDGE